MERALFLVAALITRAFNETAGTSIRTEDFTVRLHRAYRPLLSVVTASYKDDSLIVRVKTDIIGFAGYDHVSDFFIMDSTDPEIFDDTTRIWNAKMLLDQSKHKEFFSLINTPAYRALEKRN